MARYFRCAHAHGSLGKAIATTATRPRNIKGKHLLASSRLPFFMLLSVSFSFSSTPPPRPLLLPPLGSHDTLRGRRRREGSRERKRGPLRLFNIPPPLLALSLTFLFLTLIGSLYPSLLVESYKVEFAINISFINVVEAHIYCDVTQCTSLFHSSRGLLSSFSAFTKAPNKYTFTLCIWNEI
jgi:hypothetical protein